MHPAFSKFKRLSECSAEEVAANVALEEARRAAHKALCEKEAAKRKAAADKILAEKRRVGRPLKAISTEAVLMQKAVQDGKDRTAAAKTAAAAAPAGAAVAPQARKKHFNWFAEPRAVLLVLEMVKTEQNFRLVVCILLCASVHEQSCACMNRVVPACMHAGRRAHKLLQQRYGSLFADLVESTMRRWFAPDSYTVLLPQFEVCRNLLLQVMQAVHVM